MPVASCIRPRKCHLCPRFSCHPCARLHSDPFARAVLRHTRTPCAPTYVGNIMLENALSARSLDTSDAESDYSGWTGVGGKTLKNVPHFVQLCSSQLGALVHRGTVGQRNGTGRLGLSPGSNYSTYVRGCRGARAGGLCTKNGIPAPFGGAQGRLFSLSCQEEKGGPRCRIGAPTSRLDGPGRRFDGYE